jgi:hypothetical protein
VHNIKDLEKALPSIASINSMQVKDYLQALSDEGQIRIEKIGSGNWYWSFVSEEKKNRDRVLEGLREERAKIEAGKMETMARLNELEVGDEEIREKGVAKDRLEAIQREVEVLQKELDGYKDGDPVEVERRKEEVGKLKCAAERWTDNIYSLEGHLKNVLGGDREVVENMQRMYYGDEYVQGEGLRELDL